MIRKFLIQYRNPRSADDDRDFTFSVSIHHSIHLCRDLKAIGKQRKDKQLLSEEENSPIRLKLDKSGVKFEDLYLHRGAEMIGERRLLTDCTCGDLGSQ